MVDKKYLVIVGNSLNRNFKKTKNGSQVFHDQISESGIMD